MFGRCQRSWTTRQFDLTGSTRQIVQGRVSITPDTAGQLERETGVSADIWIGLDNDFRLAQFTPRVS